MATSVTGNLKDTVVTLFGFILFDDVVATTSFVTGVIISVIGAGAYSYSKIRGGKKDPKIDK